MPAALSLVLETMRAYPNMLQVCGVLGSVLYVGGFALVQSGRACGNGPLYSGSKIIAALLVLISLVGAFNLGAFLIQIGFVVFGVVGLVRQTGTPRDVPDLRPPSGYAPSAPALPDDARATSDWGNRPPGQAHDRPVPLCPVGAVPGP